MASPSRTFAPAVATVPATALAVALILWTRAGFDAADRAPTSAA